MKILAHPGYNTWSKKVSCTKCTARLEIDLIDIKAQHQPGDGPHPPSWLYCYTCPVCTWVGYVVSDDLPGGWRFMVERHST